MGLFSALALVVSLILAGVTAWGTITLAQVGKAQNRREQKRQEREETPRLLLTGARPGRHGKPSPVYRVELANLSQHHTWIDGVYADWRKAGDGRIAFDAKKLEDLYTRHRTPLAPGKLVTLANAFTDDDYAEATTEGRDAEIVAEFYYALTGTRKHRRAWHIRGDAHAVAVEELEDLPAWFVRRQEALAGWSLGAVVKLEGTWPDGPSVSSPMEQTAWPGVIFGGDEGEP